MAVLLLPLIAIVISSLTIPNSAAEVELIAKTCGNFRALRLGRFKKNYNWIEKKLIQSAAAGRRFNAAMKIEPNASVFALAECWDYLRLEDCRSCVTQMASDLKTCLPESGGRVYADGCFVRVENFKFFEEFSSPLDQKRCGISNNFTSEYANASRKLIKEIQEAAPSVNNRWVVHNIQTNGTSVHGIGKCWHTLNKLSCTNCLEKAALSASDCLPATEGMALNTGCFLRYTDHQLLESPPDRKSDSGSEISHVYHGLGAAVLITLAICAGCFGTRLISAPRQVGPSDDVANASVIKRGLQFKYSTLEKATGCFSEDHKLGQGGYGEVFRGVLGDGREIAIKRLFVSGKSRGQDVYNELDIISRAEHKNLVRLLGCCFTNDDNLLIYEYLPNRSLDLTLFDSEKTKELDWKKRLSIVIGTAEGLEYLHRECQVRIIHRDIKASNILLDLSHRPKISDFGLARFYTHGNTLISTTVAGTLGYMAPEYISQGRLTEKVDVYSYGVLILEIVSGVPNNKLEPEESSDSLVTMTWRHFESKTVLDIIDKSLGEDDYEEIKRVVQVGLLCTQESPASRPSMAMVIEMLENKNLELPIPSRPPFMDTTLGILSPLDSHGRSHSSSSFILNHSDGGPQ